MRFTSVTNTAAIIAPATSTGKSRAAIDSTRSQPRPGQAKTGKPSAARGVGGGRLGVVVALSLDLLTGDRVAHFA